MPYLSAMYFSCSTFYVTSHTKDPSQLAQSIARTCVCINICIYICTLTHGDQGPNTWRLGSEHTESRVLTQSNAHPSANLHAKQTHTLTHALTCVLMGAAGTTSGAVAAAGSGEEAKGLRVARPPPEQLPGPPRPPQGL
jgi:hypothetical protein